MHQSSLKGKSGTDLLYGLPWRDFFNIGDKCFYGNPHPTGNEMQ